MHAQCSDVGIKNGDVKPQTHSAPSEGPRREDFPCATFYSVAFISYSVTKLFVPQEL